MTRRGVALKCEPCVLLYHDRCSGVARDGSPCLCSCNTDISQDTLL